MKKTGKWTLGIIVTAAAAAGAAALQNTAAPADLPTTSSPAIIVTETEMSTLAYEGCGYMWAYHDDPELTEKVNAAVKGLDPTASATATLFGEDCVYADGHSTFGVMETDFKVRSSFDAFNNEEAFGNWMKQVMDLILQIPAEEIRGPNDGHVEFLAVKGEVATFVVRVPIQKYRTEAQGKTGTELFRLFSENQP